MDKKIYYTVKEISEIVKLSRQAVDKRISSRKIDVMKFGRTKVIKSTDLESVIKD